MADELMATPEATASPEASLEAMASLSISKRFDGFRLEAELTCGPGITALVGPSGSGKTTLIRCLAGLEAPDAGVIRVGDETWFDAARGVNRRVQERRVGFVFNDFALFPEMTVARNAAFGARRPEAASEWLELLDIGALGDRLPRQLSAGQQQRVALARALASEPRLLLMDEPFTSLDPHLRERVYVEFAQLIQRIRIPVVLVTHDLAEASLLGSAMVVLERGRVAQAGAPEEILLRPASPAVASLAGYRNVFETPQDGHGRLLWGRHALRVGGAATGGAPGEAATGGAPGEAANDGAGAAGGAAAGGAAVGGAAVGGAETAARVGWCVRGDRLEVLAGPAPGPNVLQAVVRQLHLTATGYRVRVAVEGAEELELVRTFAEDAALRLAVGELITLRVPPEAIQVFTRGEAGAMA